MIKLSDQAFGEFKREGKVTSSRCHVCAGLILATLLGCGAQKERPTVDGFMQASREAGIGYCSRDIDEAEAALKAFNEQIFARYKGQIKGMEVNTTLEVNYGRLMLIYDHKGDSAKADECHLQALKYLNLDRESRGLHETNFSKKDWEAIINQLDQMLEPKWKARPAVTSRPSR